MNHYLTTAVDIEKQCLLVTRGLLYIKLNYSSNRRDEAGKITQSYNEVENT